MGIQVKLEALASKDVLIAGALTAVAIIGKVLSGLGCPKRMNRWAVGFGMMPRGEVGLIFAGIGKDGFTDMSEGSPSRYGGDARLSLAEQATKLFANYYVKFVPIVIEISVMDSVAFDRGWHEFLLAPKAGGETIRKRYRYFNTWKKLPNGDWKISLHVNNTDVPEQVGGVQSTWFLSEKEETTAR
jgi:Kef-type K+ transport system membrane component KefB